ncbi:MAG: hypothetical protein HXS54_05855 [Theionarchaea archaeon]|nr:hypothetical protein [Theionarchaea archaeon]DBA34892.1 TPA_asm: hypothetical protein vir521_00098 [Caudoviricetes sp. vir521]
MVTIQKEEKRPKRDLRALIPIPIVADLRYVPNVEMIYRVKEAYRGRYVPVNPETGVRTGNPREGIGAIVFLSTEIPVQQIVAHPVLDRESMSGTAYDIIQDFWEPDPLVFRPPFRDSLASFTRELWHAGFAGAERYFATTSWEGIRDRFLKGQLPPEPCSTVILRPSQNHVICRDEQTGFISQAPHFMRYSAERDGEPTTNYIGPFHVNQMLYGAIHTRSFTDYYGMSPFEPLMTEIEAIGKGFKVISSIARDVIKPRLIVNLVADAGEEDMTIAINAANEFLDNMDQGENDSVLVSPNTTRTDFINPKMNFSDVYEFIRGMHKLIEIYLGIPETLLFSEANRANTEAQILQFEKRMSTYRDLIWGWWERHFRLLLYENEIEDWETTPIIVKWGAEGEVTEDEQEYKPPEPVIGMAPPPVPEELYRIQPPEEEPLEEEITF